MTSLSNTCQAFPGTQNPTTLRRVSAASWAHALRPYFRYVHVGEEGDSEPVVAENGNYLVLTLKESSELRGHWPLWDLNIYSRRTGVEYTYKVGNLQDVLVSLLRDV